MVSLKIKLELFHNPVKNVESANDEAGEEDPRMIYNRGIVVEVIF
jgi:hypothetical protein